MDYGQIAEYLEHDILHRFKTLGKTEKLVMNGVIMIDYGYYVIEATGDYTVTKKEDEYSINVWLLSVALHDTAQNTTVYLDTGKIENLINKTQNNGRTSLRNQTSAC